MKQIRLGQFGAPAQVARCETVLDPGPVADWEVLVEVDACTINPADMARMAGRYGDLPSLPSSIGMEGAGVVRECGAAVRDVQVGDHVVIVANDNWAQRRKVPASTVVKIDPSIDLVQASAFKVNPATALCLVRRQLTLQPGEWIVQSAPRSSVGRCVIDVARHDGLRTINIVRRTDEVQAVLDIGGDVALLDGPDLLARVHEVTKRQPIRLALDAVGGPGVASLAGLLAPGGRIACYGMLSTQPASVGLDQLIFRGITLSGFWLSKTLSRMTRSERDDLIRQVEQLYLSGYFRMNVAAEFSLEEIGPALRAAEASGSKGKIVLRPQRSR